MDGKRNVEEKFGARIRALRLERKLGLREFAKSVDMSPAYLSKIERDEFKPPAEDKVRAIAAVLDQDPDELLALAGRVASDLREIIREEPKGLASFLRTARGLSAEQLEKLTQQARQKGRKKV